MQGGLGRISEVEKQQSTKGSTSDAGFKVSLLDPYTLHIMYDCGVLSR
jgi:hypothetical protein